MKISWVGGLLGFMDRDLCKRQTIPEGLFFPCRLVGLAAKKKCFLYQVFFVLVSMSNVQKICQIILEFHIFRDIIFLIKYTYINTFLYLY